MTDKLRGMTTTPTITDYTAAITAIMVVMNDLEKQIKKCEKHGNSDLTISTYNLAHTRLRWALETMSHEVWRKSSKLA